MLYLHIFHYNEKILKARAYLVWFTALFPETKVLGKSCLLKKKKKIVAMLRSEHQRVLGYLKMNLHISKACFPFPKYK